MNNLSKNHHSLLRRSSLKRHGRSSGRMCRLKRRNSLRRSLGHEIRRSPPQATNHGASIEVCEFDSVPCMAASGSILSPNSTLAGLSQSIVPMVRRRSALVACTPTFANLHSGFLRFFFRQVSRSSGAPGSRRQGSPPADVSVSDAPGREGDCSSMARVSATFLPFNPLASLPQAKRAAAMKAMQERQKAREDAELERAVVKAAEKENVAAVH